MKSRTLSILGLFALALGSFIFFYERNLLSTDERRAQEKKIVPVEAEDVTALTLRGEKHEVRLVKEETAGDDEELGSPPARWRIEEPYAARAESSEVEALVGRLVGLEKSRTLEKIDEAQLGLVEPRATAVIEAGEKSFTVRVGTDLPLSADVVVQGEDRKIAFQVAGTEGLVEEITRGADEWREKSLFDAERADIESITLESDGESLLLSRRGDGESFWLEAPIDDRADTQDVSGLLTTITGLEAESFPEEAPTGVETGLDSPSQAIEVRIAGEENPWRLELGLAVDTLSPEGSLRYARLGDQLVEIDAAGLEEALAKSADAWRSRAWSSMQVFKVDTATFTLDGEAIEIRRDAGEWLRTMGDTSDVKLDYTAASDALYPLTEVRAVELVERSEADLGEPRLEILLIASDGAEENLKLYAAEDDSALAATAGRDAVLRLAAEDAKKVISKVEALRDAEPFAEEESATTE